MAKKNIPSEVFSSLAIQFRVIDALMRREMIVFYGRKGIGFLMNFIEPMFIMCFVMIPIAMKSAKHFKTASFPIYAFVLTGWGVMWTCRYVFKKMPTAILANKTFLYHRNITTVDILISRTFVLIGSVQISFWSIFAFYLFFLETSPVYQPIYIVVSFLLLYWYVFIVSLAIGIIRAYFPMGHWLSLSVSVLHVWVTGAFLMADWVKQPYRDIYLLLPVVNMTEMFRYGVFGNIVRCHFSVQYVFMFNMIMSFIFLLFTRNYAKNANIYDNPE